MKEYLWLAVSLVALFCLSFLVMGGSSNIETVRAAAAGLAPAAISAIKSAQIIDARRRAKQESPHG